MVTSTIGTLAVRLLHQSHLHPHHIPMTILSTPRESWDQSWKGDASMFLTRIQEIIKPGLQKIATKKFRAIEI